MRSAHRCLDSFPSGTGSLNGWGPEKAANFQDIRVGFLFVLFSEKELGDKCVNRRTSVSDALLINNICD